MAPRRFPESPKIAEEGPAMAQDASKKVLKWPRGLEDGPMWGFSAKVHLVLLINFNNLLNLTNPTRYTISPLASLMQNM